MSKRPNRRKPTKRPEQPPLFDAGGPEQPSPRPAFDPARIRTASAAANQSETLFPAIPPTLHPRDVNELVRGAISRHIPSTLHVIGQITDISRPVSGHLYFALKDSESELRCVMWRSAAINVAFRPEEGMQVIATGGLDVYTPRGTYQLLVRKLEPRGVGALELAFRQLRDKLQREGLFDQARKRPLPRIPRRIAIITSPSGAAIRDILQTLQRRYHALDVFVFPVSVQGEGSAAEIAAAIHLMNATSESLGGIDVAIVGRGGGSLEDLWAFNEEVVARAVAASRVPIVSAVGHEIDFTICDMVADVRAATPTAAAELVTPRLVDLRQRIDECDARVARRLRHVLDLARSHLDRRLASPWFARPVEALSLRRSALADSASRVDRALLTAVHARRAAMRRSEAALHRFGAGAHFLRLAQRLDGRVAALRQRLWERVVNTSRRLATGNARLQGVMPMQRVARCEDRLRNASERLRRAAQQALADRRATFETRSAALAACDPKQVLRRGYSLTRDAATGRVLRSVYDVRDGFVAETELADGKFRSVVDASGSAGPDEAGS